MRRAWMLVGLLLTGCTLATVTPSPSRPTVPVATATLNSAATPVPTALPTPAPTPTIVPQVVNVIDNPANVRVAASSDADVFATLDVGTELSVLSPDVTGPDGVTRWVHVAANGRDGYVRSDLVSAPHVYVAATATIEPTRPITPLGPTRVASAEELATVNAVSTRTAGQTPTGRTTGAPVRVGSGDLAVTLYRYLDPAPIGNAIGPPAGNRAIAFDIEVNNLSQSPQGYNALYAYLKDTNNRRYDVNFFASDIAPQLSAGTNRAGESTRGWVVFVVPDSARVSELGYEDFSTGHRIIFTYTG